MKRSSSLDQTAGDRIPDRGRLDAPEARIGAARDPDQTGSRPSPGRDTGIANQRLSGHSTSYNGSSSSGIRGLIVCNLATLLVVHDATGEVLPAPGWHELRRNRLPPAIDVLSSSPFNLIPSA